MARTEAQWIKGLSLITPNDNVPLLLKNEYLNFGGFTIGETGYGIRNNGGIMEYKDASESWIPFSSIGGGSGVTVETPAGTVNAVNASFTVSATPKWIVADGTTYFEGAGYSIIGLVVTMDIPPSGFIRAII